jgi:putative transposase
MPWKETCPMSEKMLFIVAVEEQPDACFADLCRAFGISRKTGYKWIQRYELLGPGGLEDAQPIAYHHPRALDLETTERITIARKEHPTWGPKKLRALLAAAQLERLPSASAIGEVLKRQGLIRPRRRRLRAPISSTARAAGEYCNALWAADFKGHFALGDGTRCYPLTISDDFSRYLIKTEGMHEPKGPPVMYQFKLAFQEFGLPDRIRTDNGPPFVSVGIGGLTELNVWWTKLGIGHERIDPGRPDQNGRHERMHRTLKAEATKPPGGDLSEQQYILDRFRHEYNDVRPHEALGQKPPATVYRPSARQYPAVLGSPQYGNEYVVRTVSRYGRISWGKEKVYISTLLVHEPVGLHQSGDDEWELYYGPVFLGLLVNKGKPHLEHRSTKS